MIPVHVLGAFLCLLANAGRNCFNYQSVKKASVANVLTVSSCSGGVLKGWGACNLRFFFFPHRSNFPKYLPWFWSLPKTEISFLWLEQNLDWKERDSSLTRWGLTNVKQWYDFSFGLVRDKDVAKNSNMRVLFKHYPLTMGVKGPHKYSYKVLYFNKLGYVVNWQLLGK